MRRWIFFAYAVGNYLLFLGVYAYLAGFLGNFLVPKSIDSAPTEVPEALVVDLLLIGLFATQHSIMARPGFKRVWTRLVPKPIERSTYMLMSSGVLAVLIWQWRGLDAVVWDVHDPIGRGLLWTLFAAGWLQVPAVSLMISHFDLFGIRQAWLYVRGRSYTALPFRTPMLYNRVRHPLYLGWALAFWATPTMSLGHLLFAGTLTVYMALAAVVEERDLIGVFGEQYRAYRRRVPMFIPRLILRDKPAPATSVAAPVAVR